MSITRKEREEARFDTRLSREQKELFKRAAVLGGYRNLTDFVVRTLQERAKDIIADHERIIVSEKDSEVFFNELLNPSAPNDELLKAAKDFNALLSK